MMNDRRPLNIILSINPKYVDNIPYGEKSYEFRKRIYNNSIERELIKHAKEGCI